MRAQYQNASFIKMGSHLQICKIHLARNRFISMHWYGNGKGPLNKNLLLKLALKNFQNILGKLRDVEQELEAIGENMKQLEISAEKAQEREEKLKDKIHSLMERLKVAEARFEYGEMNVSKLNLRYTNHFHLTKALTK